MGIGKVAWHGPRPLDANADLIGRGVELRELSDRCRTYDIVQITARSGVGKTSFMVAGGVPALRKQGYHVPELEGKRWWDLLDHPAMRRRRPSDGDADTQRETAEVLYRLVIDADPELDGRTPAEVALDIADGGRMAVVLDQLDELLRYLPVLGAALLDVAGTCARDSSIVHVAIARSEYRERLRPVEVPGAKVWNLFLDEIAEDSAIARIIRQPAEKVGVGVDDAAVRQIIEWWNEARAASSDAQAGARIIAPGEIGLLHLQALLWLFQRWAVENGVGDEVGLAELLAFADGRGVGANQGQAGSVSPGARLVEDALCGYVDDTVGQLTSAPDAPGGSGSGQREWTNGPRLMLARIAPVLSSAGFKIPQALSSLVVPALTEELTELTVRDLAREIRAGHKPATFPHTLEPAGIAVGWPKGTSVLLAMMASLTSVLRGLSSPKANILRELGSESDPIYELVHDGMGPALTAWSESYLDSPMAAIAVIAAQPGGAFQHSLKPDDFRDESGAIPPSWGAVELESRDGRDVVVLDSLMRNGNFIGAPSDGRLAFQDIVFRGCDFTGASFVACDFSNVTFEACVLRGTVMIGCSLRDVAFVPTPVAGTDMDLLTIKEARAGATVEFVGLAGTIALFLENLDGGTWTLHDCQVTHLAVSAKSPTVLALRRSTIRHATIDDAVTRDFDSQSDLVYDG